MSEPAGPISAVDLRVGERVAQRDGGTRSVLPPGAPSSIEMKLTLYRPAVPPASNSASFSASTMSRALPWPGLREQRVDGERGADDLAAAADRLQRASRSRRARERRRRSAGAATGALALDGGRLRRGPRARRARRRAANVRMNVLSDRVGGAGLAARVDERGVPARQRQPWPAASGRSRSAARAGSARASLNTCLVAVAACFLLPGKAIREPVAAHHEAAGLREPDLARGRGLQQRARARGR